MDRKTLTTNIITAAFKSKEGHIGSALSILDFMMCLYDEVLQPEDEFVLSKGHASLALYAVMAEKGIITHDELFGFCGFDSKLGGHPSSKKIPQVKISTGSLGHGFPFAVGLALAKKIKNEKGRIYCLIGDGEANEGTIWESALLAGSLRLDNLTCIMDFNKSGERAVRLWTGMDKFQAFEWHTYQIDGHVQEYIGSYLRKNSNKPIFIELRTIKGKGCPVMERDPHEWHHKYPASQTELDELLKTVY